MKKHTQKDICVLGPWGTHRTVMSCGCSPSNPEQASPERGRHKLVHPTWIPDPLLLSNIDIAYRLYNSVLKLSPWVFAALRILRFFLYPMRKTSLFFPFHYFFQIEMFPIYILSTPLLQTLNFHDSDGSCFSQLFPELLSYQASAQVISL